MIKIYCDICGTQITHENQSMGGVMVKNRLGVEIKNHDHRFYFEVVQSKNSTANDGDICRYCVLDALYRLDDRTERLSTKDRGNRFPSLDPVIAWLENGCDPKEAVKELRILREKLHPAQTPS